MGNSSGTLAVGHTYASVVLKHTSPTQAFQGGEAVAQDLAACKQRSWGLNPALTSLVLSLQHWSLSRLVLVGKLAQKIKEAGFGLGSLFF